MNIERLNNVINEYIKHVSNIGDIEAINERNERKLYYKSWTKERIKNNEKYETEHKIGIIFVHLKLVLISFLGVK